MEGLLSSCDARSTSISLEFLVGLALFPRDFVWSPVDELWLELRVVVGQCAFYSLLNKAKWVTSVRR